RQQDERHRPTIRPAVASRPRGRPDTPTPATPSAPTPPAWPEPAPAPSARTPPAAPAPDPAAPEPDPPAAPDPDPAASERDPPAAPAEPASVGRAVGRGPAPTGTGSPGPSPRLNAERSLGVCRHTTSSRTTSPVRHGGGPRSARASTTSRRVARTRSAASDVTGLPGIPHGTM